MAVENKYCLVQALTDLRETDLLHSVLLPSGNSLQAFPYSEAIAKCSNKSFQGAGFDSRKLKVGALFVALAGEKVDGRQFVKDPLANGNWVLTRSLSDAQVDPLLNAEGKSGVILSPDPEKALACLATAWRSRLKVKIVGVTGTNGKTTTKDLLGCLLSGAGKTQTTAGNFNNHLGLPLTLLNLDQDCRYAVVEMGASSRGEIEYLAGLTQPQVGVITNASRAHLAEFGSLENIIAGKGELLGALPAEGTAILNQDSPGFDFWCQKAKCKVVSWGEKAGDHKWDYRDGQLLLDGSQWPVPLPGRHNAANLCAAILAAGALKISEDVLRQGLSKFEGSDHRGRVVHWQGRTIIDDSYNANPASMLAAVQSLLDFPGAGRTIAILGAMAELGPESEQMHLETGLKLAGTKLDHLIAVGKSAFSLTEGFSGSAGSDDMDNHQEAARWLLSNTKTGDKILIKGSRSSAMESILDLLSECQKPGTEI